MQTDKPFEPLSDGRPDCITWNACQEITEPKTWFRASWLFSECYLYRKINEILSGFKGTVPLRDPFQAKKKESWMVSNVAMAGLSHFVIKLAPSLPAGDIWLTLIQVGSTLKPSFAPLPEGPVLLCQNAVRLTSCT